MDNFVHKIVARGIFLCVGILPTMVTEGAGEMSLAVEARSGVMRRHLNPSSIF